MKTCTYRPDMRQFFFAIIYLLFMALLTVSFIQVTDVDVKDFFASSNIMVREFQNKVELIGDSDVGDNFR